MKKLLLFALAVCFGFYVSAQGFSFGAKFGPGFSNVRGEAIDDVKDAQNNKTNYTMVVPHFGAFANYSFGLISAQLEMNLAQKGYKSKFTHQDGHVEEAKAQFTYLEIPILAKVTFGEDWPVQVFGELGPFVGMLMGVKYDGKSEQSYEINGVRVTEKYKDYYKGMDLGVAVGAGAIFMILDNLGIIGNFRYNLGLTQIGDHSVPANAGYTSDQVNDIKTGVFNFDVGAVFYLGK